MNFPQNIIDHINAGFTGLWVETSEPNETEDDLATLAKQQSWSLLSWDIAAGIKGTTKGQQDPVEPLKKLLALADSTNHTIMILHNYHKALTNPVVIQHLFNTIIAGKTQRAHVVILSPYAQIPPELEKVIIILDYPLPTEPELKVIATELIHEGDPEPSKESIAAAAGLTNYEAEGAFAMALAKHDKIQTDEIWKLKSQMVKKSGVLDMHRGQESFADLGGLDELKSFCTKALTLNHHQTKPKPKGILLLGVPGAGKSAFAKALGNETSRPTLIFDVGAMFGSLVGQTEERVRRALKTADAMSPCILFIDEIEKALGGSNGSNNGDSGVSQRLFGTLLSWMNDHTSDVFFIGTCNNINQLPPEFSRAERFDAIFFVDLPTKQERMKIWEIYTNVFDIKDPHFPDQDNWTGAEIKACCRLSALLNVSMKDAAKNIVPIANTAGDKIQDLREWATGRCLSATKPGIYHHEQKADINQRRKLTRKESV